MEKRQARCSDASATGGSRDQLPGAAAEELKRRTLTNLYNQCPTWLDLAHRTLDHAVLDAYSWPHELSDEDILIRLLALNSERVAAPAAANSG